MTGTSTVTRKQARAEVYTCTIKVNFTREEGNCRVPQRTSLRATESAMSTRLTCPHKTFLFEKKRDVIHFRVSMPCKAKGRMQNFPPTLYAGYARSIWWMFAEHSQTPQWASFARRIRCGRVGEHAHSHCKRWTSEASHEWYHNRKDGAAKFP